MVTLRYLNKNLSFDFSLYSRELAAILSGISGYILGKGINNPKQVQVKNMADAAHPHEKKE